MHIILVGCGRLGSSLANELSDFGHDVSIIERSREKLEALGSGFNGQCIQGIEFDKDKLIESDIQTADALLAVTPDDNINITVSLIAQKIYHVPLVVARVNDPNRAYIYEKLNIETINPVGLGVELLINRLNVKNNGMVSDLVDGYQILYVVAGKALPDCTVSDVEVKTPCIVSGIYRDDVFILPSKSENFLIGDRVLCTVHADDKEKLLRLFSKEMPVWIP